MEKMAEAESSETQSLDLLPSALLATIMTKLDVPSICSVASTCRTFNTCSSQILSFLPNFHLLDIAPSIELLIPLLPPNPYLRSLKIDCNRLDDSSIDYLIRPSLHELSLHNCADFSGRLLSQIGERCKELRSLYLSSVADKRGRSIHVSELEELLSGCKQLETLILMFDVSIFPRQNFAHFWALVSPNLACLEIEYIASVMVTELLSPSAGPHQPPNHIQPPVFPSIKKLCLSVDYITDTMVNAISRSLISLTHLDLRDKPIIEPPTTFDLTNAGLQHINQHGKLKHLSLIRSQEYVSTCFKRVNDLGLLLMADRCSSMESICLGGFCRVTDAGFKTILHSCSSLLKLKVSHGTQLTDLVFHDMHATSLSLTHVSLRWCNLLTNLAVTRLASNPDLIFLDLRDCRSLGDESLRALSSLPKLKTLLLDGSDISDVGLSYLKNSVMNSLSSLSVRGCKRLTDKCISSLFDGSSNQEFEQLDLSNLPNLSDASILLLARSRVHITELRMRQCPLIGDTSVMALASMQVDEDRWHHGSSLRLLDLYNCGGITQLAFRWLKKPYFPRLRWLGVTGSVNRVRSLERKKNSKSEKRLRMASEAAVESVVPEVSTEASPETTKVVEKQPHKLERQWTFWYDNQSKPKQGAAWGSSLRKGYTFDTVEEFWCLYDQIFRPSKFPANADFHLFRAGVEPKWEDPECAQGGKWTATSSRKADLDQMWLDTLMALIGEQFDESDEICGVVASVRQRQDKLSLWTKNAANEAVQMSIGRKWKDFIDVTDKISYISHDDSKRERSAKTRYSV